MLHFGSRVCVQPIRLSLQVLLVVLLATAGMAAADVELITPETGGVAFKTWTNGEQRFTSVSLDDGATWSEPRAMIDEIPLQAGVIVPGVSMPATAKSIPAEGNRLFIVQFETQSLAEWRHQLADIGIEVLNYLPHNAHIVRMDPGLVSTVEALPFVRWVGVYEPSYRTFPEILENLDRQSVHSRRYNVMTWVSGAAEKALLSADVQAVGGQVVAAIDEGYILEAVLTDAQLLDLLPSNYLQWVDEWSAPEEDMNNGRIVSGADYVAATPGGYDGTGVRAEVCDGGVDTDHPDFINPVPIHGAVSSAGDSHGTCTYGINFGNGSGAAAATGMAPNAYGYFAYYNALSNRYTHTEELVNPALEYKCVYQSNSWGNTTTTLYNSYSQQMDDIIWQYDISIFQSQSNTGSQLSRPQAWAKNIVSVGGHYHNNDLNPDNDVWNGGSSKASVGPASDGRVKPDLTYFYDAIYTTDADPGGYTTGAYYANFGGTSGATPMTAGITAIFYEMWSDDVWGTSSGSGTVFGDRPHFSTMKALLINTANQYDWNTTNPDLTRFRQGWGFPDAETAYDRAPLTRIVNEDYVLAELEADTFTATVPAAQPELKVTMVYADYPGTTSSSLHRINDVTLKVTAPDATVYWGNEGLISGGIWSTAGGSADTINTVENVFIQNPAAGDWTIEVIASEVNQDVHVETPEDDQDYALVVYGVTGMTGGADSIFSDDFEDGTADAWVVSP